MGSALRRVRERRRYRQGQLAISADITRAQFARYERRREQPSVAALVALLSALGCSAEEYARHFGPWGCLSA